MGISSNVKFEYLNIYVWTPHFGSMRFPLDGELDFDFEKLIFID